MHKARLCYVTIDCNDLDASYQFWLNAVSGTAESFGDSRDETYRRLRMPNSDLRIVLQQVPDTKTFKTPVHICIESDDVSAETKRLIAIGARLVSEQGEFGRPLNVLADPFGNEFCVVQPAYEDLLETAGSFY